ncbi:MAG: hypothetical protein CBC78_000685 [Candidatus Pelagibacter sp. TMED118]|nr:MAG: hypothetical protein CBC78_000685 [Candidatus Pelagibacter sp. TMED118]|tara:strand:- start:2126 stop:3001 length:876 start_codon:yes stop_codon:yes gene_type:complete
MGIGKIIQQKKKILLSRIYEATKNPLPKLYDFLVFQEKKKKFKKSLNRKKNLIDFKCENPDKINSYEYNISSQNNEDGIIEYIFSLVPNDKFFFEIGFEYNQSNTLNLIKNKWNGILVDANKNTCDLTKDLLKIYFKNSKINIINKYVNKKNISELVQNINIDFFSIDIDGVDYWVLKNINLNNIKVVCLEYNPFLGNECITIPYSENFKKDNDQYFGASLDAYCELLKSKQFEFIATDSSGTNAFFVKEEYKSLFEVLDHKKSYKKSGYFDEKEFEQIQKETLNNDFIKL